MNNNSVIALTTLVTLSLTIAACDDTEAEFDASAQTERFGFGGYCGKPVRAVLETLDCIEAEDAECAGAGYNPEFVKLHNGVDTNTVIEGPEFWAGAFQLLDITLDYDHIRRVGWDQISLRYVETVVLPFTGQTFLQHEHALVTVDEDCRMVLWDQYGDNAEQTAVDDAVAAFLASLGG